MTSDPAVAFAPLVRIHEDEQAWPMSADDFIGYATLTWANDPCFMDETVAIGGPRLRLRKDEPERETVPARLGGRRAKAYRQSRRTADCAGHVEASYLTSQHTRPYDQGAAGLNRAEGFYLDLLTDRLEGTKRVSDRGGQAYLGGVPVYVDRRPERVGGAPGLRLTYWFLYGAELPHPERIGRTVGHEGDWDRVSVLLRRGRGARRYVPASVRYHDRRDDRDVAWRSVDLAGGPGPPTHPVVFSARGSHTPYPSAGERDVPIRVDGKRLALVDDTVDCADCARWETWKTLRPLRAEPWYGYGGGWGRTLKRGLTTGPLGPSPFIDR